MKVFDFHRATSPQNATASMHRTAKFLGGGTNLIDLMKLEIEHPDRLVDVTRTGLNTIEDTEDGGLRIGALVTNSALASDPRIRERYHLLSEATLSGATVQLRNKATTAGNFLQRTRCYYFYEKDRACNKRQPGSGCDAMHGLNRNHAILGTSDHCIATHPSDMSVAMVALDAQLETIRADGETRTIPARELHRLPGDTPHIETVLADDEMITAVILPPKSPSRQLYRKVRDRSSYAFALVSVAAAADAEDGRLTNVRLALGGVGTKPWRADRAEAALRERSSGKGDFRAAAKAELAQAQGRGENDFKIELAERLIVAALSDLLERN